MIAERTGASLAATGFAPVPQGERSQWLDALRGFALLGILLANIAVFSGYAFMPPSAQAQLQWNAADGALRHLTDVLIEAKFYSLFSFLFGLGFMVQVQRIEAGGGDAAAMFRRRMAWLLLFGLGHAFLLWFGDILNFYALLGFALLLFRKLPARALLGWAVFFLAAPIWLYAGFIALTQVATLPATNAPASGMRAILDSFAHGDYPQIVGSNAQIYAFAWVRRIFRFQLIRIFGMFLLGAWAARIGLPFAREALRSLLRRWLAVGLVIGLPLNIAFAALGGNDALSPAGAKGLLAITSGSIGIPLLSLGYAAAFALLWRDRRGRVSCLVASGRMALSHYLAQSALCVLVFYGIGFGWFQRTSLGVSMLIAFAVFVVLAMLCRWWLAGHAQGPMEALWRRLSYRRG